MPIMNSDELNAKALIAAALIQSRTIDISPFSRETTNWTAVSSLVELNRYTQMIYDAVKGVPPPNQ